MWQDKDNMEEISTLENENEAHPLHFSLLHRLLKKILTENNAGQTTFSGQQIYVLFRPF